MLMAALGDTLEAVGIAVLALTLYYGYELYSGIGGISVLPTLPSNVTISKSIGSLVTGLLSSSNSFMTLLLKVIVLFLFANIGYKFVALGIHMNKVETEKEESAKQESKEGMNKY